ncbi:MAG: hypothetical protein N2422_07810 [Rhodobacteraceae bacterium]|nr:hypothetical protein [Paracoccaceae bacterium]
MILIRTLIVAAALAAGPCGVPGAVAEDRPVYQRDGYAIGGYDPVAYFLFGKAMKGSPAHALVWRGATWLFVSDETMLSFEMNPEAYAPRFGGYCAYGVSEGRLAGGDPELFSIIDGRLYLNRNKAARDAWNAHEGERAAAAEENWPAVLGQ